MTAFTNVFLSWIDFLKPKFIQICSKPILKTNARLDSQRLEQWLSVWNLW